MEQLGQMPEELFSRFDLNAMASASIGQVHRATLRDGKSVVVKVQHEGIQERVTNDLKILVALADLAEAHAPQLL
ncbi:MAG: AarF/UbiB family protein [Aeoliella sp.]